MKITNEIKIRKAVEDSKEFPNPTIEYNFEEKVDMKLFKGVNAVENKSMEKNSAKIIYKFV